MSCSSSPGTVISSSSTTGVTGGGVEPQNATPAKNGVSAYLFSGTFYSANEKEREHPVHIGGSVAGESVTLSGVKLTIVGRYVWE